MLILLAMHTLRLVISQVFKAIFHIYLFHGRLYIIYEIHALVIFRHAEYANNISLHYIYMIQLY